MSNSDERARPLAVFIAGYLKRYAERHVYDRLFETAVGDRLNALDRDAKYAVEFGLNGLAAFFDQHLAADTTLKRLVRDVGVDAAPEISKRLLNHDRGGPSPSDSVVRVLLALEPRDLTELLTWLFEQPALKRDSFLDEIRALDHESLQRLSKLEPEMRSALLSLEPKSQETSFLPPRWRRRMEKDLEMKDKDLPSDRGGGDDRSD